MISCTRSIRTDAELAMRYTQLGSGLRTLPNFPVTHMAIAEPLKEYGLTSLPYSILRPHAEQRYTGIDLNTAALTHFFQLTYSRPAIDNVDHDAGQVRLIFPLPGKRTYQCINMGISTLKTAVGEQLNDFNVQAGTKNMPKEMAHDIAQHNGLLHRRVFTLIGPLDQKQTTSGNRLVFNN
jgi:hypothetical protein